MNISSDIDTFNIALDAIEDTISNELIILLASITQNSQKLHLLKTDYELNIIQKIETEIEELDFIGRGIILQKDLINNDSYNIIKANELYRVNTEGEIINYQKFDSNPYYSNIIPFSNGQILYGNSNSALKVLDYSFTVDSTYVQQEDYLNTNIPKIIKSPNNEYSVYIAGLSHIDYAEENVLKDALIRVLIDENIKTDLVLIYNENQETRLRQTGLFSLDLYNEENIFFCNNDNTCITFDSNNPCTEIVNFYNFNGITDELNYVKYLGGDATYIPLDIIALPNNDVIMFLARYEIGVNEQYETDTYFIKFDAQGNQIELNPELYTSSAVKPLSIPIFDVLVYPNPTTDFLNFKTHLNKNEIELNIYNINGQLVSQNQAITEMVRVENLAKGVYIYELKNAEKVIQRGEFVKE